MPKSKLEALIRTLKEIIKDNSLGLDVSRQAKSLLNLLTTAYFTQFEQDSIQ